MTEENKAEEQNSPAEEKPEEKKEAFKVFASKKEHDEYVENALKERLARKDKKLEEEKAEAERKAREQALRDQEDWKKLAEERTETISEKDKRIEELSATAEERDQLQERVSALEGLLKGQMKMRLEAVPELYRPFVESMTVEEQATWLEKNAEKLGLSNVTEIRPRGSLRTGPPASRHKDGKEDEEVRKRQRQTGISSI